MAALSDEQAAQHLQAVAAYSHRGNRKYKRKAKLQLRENIRGNTRKDERRAGLQAAAAYARSVAAANSSERLKWLNLQMIFIYIRNVKYKNSPGP